MVTTTLTNTVTIFIDDVPYQVPAGANLVDAAKQLGIDIPVFCHHPKMKPVGMCRMCLVEMGSAFDPKAKQIVRDDAGNPQVRWMPKLQTACTTNVSEGLAIRTTTQVVEDARRSVVEFLLTSHPLDCPICQKGGECPLQNHTMRYGPGTSRMAYEDKKRLDKHVPLGDLIFLDEERCIQCARCIRFQAEIVGDDVLAFHERGRSLQIITDSTPEFDSYFSGNTTDICPVGALLTTDYHYDSRPWEVTQVGSICPHCPVGCNTTADTRLDRDFGGKANIRRIMPRQNEQVNEIWICDKGRFGHNFTRSADRLMQPVVNGAATPWGEALRAVADKLKGANGDIAAIAGSMMSNEDLFALRQVVTGLGGKRLGAWPPTHAGADLVAQAGVGKGTNLGKLGKGDAVLVIASDLEEEAPIWYLRVKQAHDRGAYLVVMNARSTRLDDWASETIRYDSGDAANALSTLAQQYPDYANKLTGAANLVVIVGAEGQTLDGSRALMAAAANLLAQSGHVGKPNNGLMATFPGANGMGLYYMGYTPEQSRDIAQNPPKTLIVAQADLLGEDPQAADWLNKVETLIVLDLFPSNLTARAAAALPVQSFAERDGSFTNGERRVQRFYTAQGPMGEALPAWQALNRLGELLGQGRARLSAAAVMQEISAQVPAFAGITFPKLAEVVDQFPDVGGGDLYYGGTAYRNRSGIGIQIEAAADRGEAVNAAAPTGVTAPKKAKGKLVVVPTVRLYNRQPTFLPSDMMHNRIPEPYAEINSADAKKLGIADGDVVQVSIDNGTALRVRAHVNGGAPVGTVVLPRHLGDTPAPLDITYAEISKVGS
jgi:NADH-quinone oxidoreductase subunit G